MEQQEIQNLINDSVKKAVSFSTAKYGDTPTDALQLVNKKYADALSSGYWGAVASGGSATRLPTGWTCSRSGTGDYVITHNLGSAVYGVVANSFSATTFIRVAATDANTFEILSYDAAGNLADSATIFILIQ